MISLHFSIKPIFQRKNLKKSLFTEYIQNTKELYLFKKIKYNMPT